MTDRDPSLAPGKQAIIAAEFDAWAPTYETGRLAPWYKMHAREAFRHLDLTGATRVLEIGCGTGWALRKLAKDHPDVRFVGIDLSQGMIAEAERLASAAGLSNIAFHCGNWEEWGPLIASGRHPEIEPGFDALLAFSSLHYMIDIHSALESIRESLYDGGQLLLVERATEGSLLTGIWDALHKHVLKDGARFFGSGELLDMMRTVGFEGVGVLAEKRQLLRYGKLFTSIMIAQGQRPDATT